MISRPQGTAAPDVQATAALRGDRRAPTDAGAAPPLHTPRDPEVRTRVRRLYDKLREGEERFRTMADSAPVLLWMAEPNSLCSFFNKTWLEFSGRPLEQELGNGWAEGIHAEDFQRSMDVYLSAFVQRQPFRMEYRLRRADGEYRWILDQGVPRFAPSGSFAGYIGSCIDITDLKQAQQTLERSHDELELRVQERTAELQRSNEELEQFAYVASHDLQAPLRAILGYVRLLEDKFKGQLDTDTSDFFGFITEGAHRMNALIKDLLEFSRTGRAVMLQTQVDCNEIMRAVLGYLSSEIKDCGARIEAGNLPTITADPTHLTQLLQNLVGNALKFKGEIPPEVMVNAESRATEWLFSVRDNGIGIAPEHAKRIFQVFQRLHTSDEYPGTGIGLAICKKIVERLGGQIWVESEPGHGSTFFFTISKEPKQAGDITSREAQDAQA